MTKISILIASTIILSSCFTERIDLDLNAENKKIAVDAWITDLDEPQFVTISQTVNYLGDQSIDYVSDAEVRISDDSTTYLLTEEETGKYYLPSDWVPRVGNMYELNITYGGNQYSASHRMRPCPEIDSIRYEAYDPSSNIFEEDAFSEEVYEVLFSFQELPGSGDGYYFIDYLKNSSRADSAIYGGYTNDEFIDGQYLDEVTVTEINEFHFLGDTAVIEMHSVGTEATKFIEEIETEIFRDGPFDPPPANVRTNISNGAVGYFIVASARREEIVIGQEQQDR